MQGLLSFQKLNSNRNNWTWSVALVLGALLVGACIPIPPIDSPSGAKNNMPQENQADTSPVEKSPTPTSPSREERLDPASPKVTPASLSKIPDNPVTGQVPQDLLNEILRHLASRQDTSIDAIQVVQAQSVVWPDGSLGCPKPGEYYTQALVNGYWVILQIDRVYYDYRVSDSGHFILCDGRGRIPISPPYDTPTKQ